MASLLIASKLSSTDNRDDNLSSESGRKMTNEAPDCFGLPSEANADDDIDADDRVHDAD